MTDPAPAVRAAARMVPRWVARLGASGVRQTSVYLNVDMVGSPNAVPAVYDGAPAGWPSGSGTVRDVLADYAGTVDPDAVLLEGRMPSLVDVDHSLVLFSGLVKDGRIGHAPEPETRRLPQWWPGK